MLADLQEDAMTRLDGVASLSSRKAMEALRVCSKTHGELAALAMTITAAEVVNAEEVTTAIASGVISLGTWLVTVKMKTQDPVVAEVVVAVVGQEPAISAKKKAI